MPVAPSVARAVWRTLEPIHGMVYFVPEKDEEYDAIGLQGARMGYFASRAAPMGAVPAEVVIATFFNFEPGLIRRAIPQAWALASPAEILDARLRVVDRALRRLLGDEALLSPELREALELARRVAESCRPEGRPLFAGHASLPWPDEPHLALWHAQSLLREHRGDGHIAAMTAEGITGCEALVIHGATGDVPPAVLQATRAWSDESWAATKEALQARGFLDAEGALTDAGRAHRAWVEERTDVLAAPPYDAIGEEACQRLRALCRPFSKTIAATAFAAPPLG